MLLDRTHRGWLLFSLLVLIGSSIYFWFYYQQSYEGGGNGPSGQSWPGLAFGIAGFGMMIFCALLGVRKKVRIWRLGKAQTWLRAHIWFGLLSGPLIFFHAGLRWGNNLSFWITVLSVVVIVSGIIGLFLQNLLPRALLTRVPAESTFEQIPEVIGVLRKESDEMVAELCGPLGVEGENTDPNQQKSQHIVTSLKSGGHLQGKVSHTRERGAPTGPAAGSEPLKTFYLTEVRPFLVPEYQSQLKVSLQRSSRALFDYGRTLVPPTLHGAVSDLESICEERRQLNIQARLHFWLHSWLFMHGPLSYLLIVLGFWHAIKALTLY